MESFKAVLVKLASGTSFVVGTSVMTIGGVGGFLGGCAFYFLGYYLMGRYKEID